MISIDAARVLVARVPGWEAVDQVSLSPLEGGLTNQTFRVEVRGESFVLRVSGENTGRLGIDREAEVAATAAAARAGLAPEVIAFLRPEGHLVRRFVAGQVWSNDDLQRPEIMRRAVETLRRVHQLPAITAEFSPFRDINQRLRAAGTLEIPLPGDLPSLLRQTEAIEQQFWRRPWSDTGLCHTDPFAGNFVATDAAVWLIDWEFAGMGDLYYDLACVGVVFPPEERPAILEMYFGRVSPDGPKKLAAMHYVMQLWNWTWALLQTRLSTADLSHAEMAERLLASVRALLPRSIEGG